MFITCEFSLRYYFCNLSCLWVLDLDVNEKQTLKQNVLLKRRRLQSKELEAIGIYWEKIAIVT